jgi:mRNA-degrading endonuclease RelE of RelBE toxin-antitoxin system
VPPGLLATPCRDWGNTGVFLEGIGGGVAFALCTKGDEEAGGKGRPSPWPGVKQGQVRLALGVLGDRCIAVGNHPQGAPAWGNEGVPQEGMGRDHACRGGPGCGLLDGLEACGDAVGRVHVVCTAAGLQGGAAGALRRCERGPAAQEVAKARRLLVVNPLQDLGEVVCERPGKAMSETDCVADEATTRRNQVAAIETQLLYQPAHETRHRKRLRPNALAEWELRVQTFRVFYDVDVTHSVVKIAAVGYKEGNTLFIHSEEYEL